MKNVLLLLFFTFIGKVHSQSNPYKMREMITEGVNKIPAEAPDIYNVVNKEISGETFSIPIRIYYPSDQKSLPVLYHIHGGAWIAGNLDTHDNICRYLSAATNTIVVAVHYRRPPEFVVEQLKKRINK